MRILHIGKYGPPFFGGIENFMMDLSEACNEQGVSSAAIVHHHQPWQKFDRREIDGVIVYRVPCYGKLMFAPISPTFGIHLERVIGEFKPDLLHIHLPNASAFFALFSSAAKRLPWVVHWHSDVLGEDSPWFLQTFYPCYRPFETAVMRRAAKIIVTSPPYLATSLALRPFKAKCVVISLGIKVEHRSASKPPREAGLRLLMVGRLTYYKGHKYLIDALGQLKQQGLTDITLTVIGGGELAERLQQQIDQCGLSAQVKLLGKVTTEQLEQQFKTADCLCLPSIERTEAFGVVLMEAAAFGLPAIVTDVLGSGMSWAVQDGQTGMVVKRADPQALTDAIKQLYQQPTLCAQLGLAALLRFEQHFKIDAVAKTTIELYNQVTSVIGQKITSHP